MAGCCCHVWLITLGRFGIDFCAFPFQEKGKTMKDENVEFNEIRCNKLILGNKETGTIILSIDEEDGTPKLGIFNDADSGTGISIGFSNGVPTLTFVNQDGKKCGIIRLTFNDKGFPVLHLFKERGENEDINEVRLGFDSNGENVLRLSNGQNEDRGFANLSVDENGRLSLMLVNRNIKGGNIIFRVDKTNAGIVMTSRDRMENEDAPWGLYIATDAEGSKLEVEGENYISESRKDKEIGESRKDEEADSEV